MLTSTPTTEIRRIPIVPGAVLAMLPGEWTVALYASDMPTRRGAYVKRYAPSQLAEWIEQGVMRLADMPRSLSGEVQTWWRYMRGEQLRMEPTWRNRAELRRMWPNRRRYANAVELSMHLWHALGPLRCDFPKVWVELPPGYGEDWCVYPVQVYERDLEMGRRRAAELGMPHS